jgi:hypothetical protein
MDIGKADLLYVKPWMMHYSHTTNEHMTIAHTVTDLMFRNRDEYKPCESLLPHLATFSQWHDASVLCYLSGMCKDAVVSCFNPLLHNSFGRIETITKTLVFVTDLWPARRTSDLRNK